MGYEVHAKIEDFASPAQKYFPPQARLRLPTFMLDLCDWQQEFNSSDVAEITLMSPGDILVLYTDGVYDGSDKQAREQLEVVLREHHRQQARDICKALLDHAVKQDDLIRDKGDEALIDDKTVFIVKRT